jgi:DNA-binding response OmpR family regulator
MHHILVVDDDPINTKLLKFLLTDEGYQVTAVHTAAEALPVLSHEQVDLILLDITMPGMDGLDLCRRIRETSSTPIIFISALSEIKEKVAALRLGGDDYIT